MPRERMDLTTFDWDPATGSISVKVSQSYDMPYSQPITLASGAVINHTGMPITYRALREALRKYVESGAIAGIARIEFSKTSILRILSQENCEFLRFWFIIPDSTTMDISLAIQGLDSNFNATAPQLEERGNGTRIIKYATEEELNDIQNFALEGNHKEIKNILDRLIQRADEANKRVL